MCVTCTTIVKIVAPSVKCLKETGSDGDSTIVYPIPNTNTSGIGFILAFVLGAYVSWILAVASYVCHIVPHELLNNVDKLVLGRGPTTSKKRISDFRKAVLVFSDQQLLTAIGFLGAGFVRMNQISVFDYQTVLYLGWMASNMHLLTLTYLRGYFQDRPILRALKIFNMGVLLVLLNVAIYPTDDFLWSDHVLNVHTACPGPTSCRALSVSVSSLWRVISKRNFSGDLAPQGVIGHIILITTYLWQASTLFRPIHGRCRHWLDMPFRNLECAISRRACQKPLVDGRCSQTSRRLMVGLYVFLLAWTDLLRSYAFLLFLMLVSLAWATYQLLTPRIFIIPVCVQAALNQWDSGQVMPLLFLLAPLYNAAGHCFKDRHALWKQSVSGQEQGKGPKLVSGTSIQSNATQDEECSDLNQPDTSVSSREPTQPPSIPFLFRCAATVPEDREIIQDLQTKMYSTTQFRIVVGLLCLVFMGGILGVLVETAVAYLGSAESLIWWKKDWRLFPAMIAGGSALFCVIFVSLLLPVFSERF